MKTTVFSRPFAEEAKAELSRLTARVAELEARLEMNFAFEPDGNGGGRKIAVTSGSVPDGIECRNETISALEASRISLREALATERAARQAAEAERDEARSEMERIKDPILRDLRLENGCLNLELSGEIVSRMALIFTDHFIATGAKNYIEFNIYGKNGDRFAFHVQKVSGGKSPHELRVEAESSLAAAEAREAGLIEALTPSGGTKGEYSGEFKFSVHDGYGDGVEDLYREVTVPWTTIKEIMKAIRARAALATGEGR
jgi:hypothetical protein